jgi:hypothetical protein
MTVCTKIILFLAFHRIFLDTIDSKIVQDIVERTLVCKSIPLARPKMQLRHLSTVLPPTEGMCKVTSIAWSPNNRRLAVVTVERVVHMFDAATGERKDKFSTKPAEKVQSYDLI